MIPEEIVNIPLPTFGDEKIETSVAEEEVTTAPLEAPVENAETESVVPLPAVQVEEDNMPEIEKEFRAIVQELIDAGLDPSDMMTDARMEDINERALAQNFETWPVFMQMVS